MSIGSFDHRDRCARHFCDGEYVDARDCLRNPEMSKVVNRDFLAHGPLQARRNLFHSFKTLGYASAVPGSAVGIGEQLVSLGLTVAMVDKNVKCLLVQSYEPLNRHPCRLRPLV